MDPFSIASLLVREAGNGIRSLVRLIPARAGFPPLDPCPPAIDSPRRRKRY
jgi:hypothetical protein